MIKRKFQTQVFVLQISKYGKGGRRDVSLMIEGCGIQVPPLVLFNLLEGKVLLSLHQHQSWVILHSSKFNMYAICSQDDTVRPESCLPQVPQNCI